MSKKQQKVTKKTTTTTTVTEEIIDSKVIETHYLLILDESGSMSGVRDVTINGFNEQIQTIKSLEKKFPEQKYFVSLITFNNDYNIKEVFFDKSASDLKEITKEDYAPNGSTALLDAMGYGISKLNDKLRPSMTSDEKEVTAVVVVMTDGEENDSKKWNQTQIKELVEKLNKDSKWTISFIGASKDAVLTGQNYGVYSKNIVSYSSTSRGMTSVADTLSATLHARATNINSGQYFSRTTVNDGFFDGLDNEIKEDASDKLKAKTTIDATTPDNTESDTK